MHVIHLSKEIGPHQWGAPVGWNQHARNKGKNQLKDVCSGVPFSCISIPKILTKDVSSFWPCPSPSQSSVLFNIFKTLHVLLYSVRGLLPLKVFSYTC